MATNAILLQTQAYTSRLAAALQHEGQLTSLQRRDTQRLANTAAPLVRSLSTLLFHVSQSARSLSLRQQPPPHHRSAGQQDAHTAPGTWRLGPVLRPHAAQPPPAPVAPPPAADTPPSQPEQPPTADAEGAPSPASASVAAMIAAPSERVRASAPTATLAREAAMPVATIQAEDGDGSARVTGEPAPHASESAADAEATSVDAALLPAAACAAHLALALPAGAALMQAMVVMTIP